MRQDVSFIIFSIVPSVQKKKAKHKSDISKCCYSQAGPRSAAVTAAAEALTFRLIDCVKVAVTVAPSALLHQRALPVPPVLRECERVEFGNEFYLNKCYAWLNMAKLV